MRHACDVEASWCRTFDNLEARRVCAGAVANNASQVVEVEPDISQRTQDGTKQGSVVEGLRISGESNNALMAAHADGVHITHDDTQDLERRTKSYANETTSVCVMPVPLRHSTSRRK